MTALDIPIVRTRADITADWLAEVLDRRVENLRVSRIGTGQMALTLRATFDDGSVVIKIAAEDDTSRTTSASTGAYTNEVEFYCAVHSRGPRAVARCHGAAIDPGGEWFTLVLDDVCDAVPADQLAGCSPREAATAVQALAEIQGHTITDPGLLHGDRLKEFPINEVVYRALLPGFAERFESLISSLHLDLLHRFGEHIDTWCGQPPGPTAVVHGDFRADNLLFTRTGLVAVDWQTASIGPAGRDLAFFLGGSVESKERSHHEPDLIERYTKTLAATSAMEFDVDEVWEAYRHQSLYGLMLTVCAAQMVAPTQRGDAMFATMLTRHAAHVMELSADEF